MSLNLILLDIEGLKLTVLQGAESQLNLPPDHAPNIIFELHRNYVDWSNGLDKSHRLRQVGFTPINKAL